MWHTDSYVNVDVGITRRVLLGQLACLASWAQTDDDPLRQLRAAHPRLILLDSDLDRLKALIRDNPLAHRIYLDLEKESDRLLTVPALRIQAGRPPSSGSDPKSAGSRYPHLR